MKKFLLLLFLLSHVWQASAQESVAVIYLNEDCPADPDTLDAINKAMAGTRRSLRLGQQNCCRFCRGWSLNHCFVANQACHLDNWDPTQCRRLGQDRGDDRPQRGGKSQRSGAKCRSADLKKIKRRLPEELDGCVSVECVRSFGGGN